MSFRTESSTGRPVSDLPDINFSHSPEEQRGFRGKDSVGLARARLLWGQRGFLFRTAVYALLASALLAFLIPKRYRSTARLMPPDDNSSGLSAASGLAAAASAISGTGRLGTIAADLLGSKSTSDTFVGILGSRTAQDALIAQFDLKKVYGDRRIEDARAELEGRTDLEVDRKSQIVSITVTDRDPRRAAAMAQAYVQELNLLVAQLSTSAARRERIFLEDRLRSVNQGLEKAEKDFSQFASKNTAINIGEQGRAMVDAAAMLQGQLIAAESELEGLRQIYSDNNARVRSLRARVEELQLQLDKLGGKDESAPGQPPAKDESMYPSIRKLPVLGVEYADLYRQTKIQETVLETLTEQYEMAKVQEAKEIPTVKVLDAADIPGKKSFPPRLLIMFFGTLLGLTFGTVWVLGYARWKTTDESDPRKIFAQEVFATVQARLPVFNGNGSAKRRQDDQSSGLGHSDVSKSLKP